VGGRTDSGSNSPRAWRSAQRAEHTPFGRRVLKGRAAVSRGKGHTYQRCGSADQHVATALGQGVQLQHGARRRGGRTSSSARRLTTSTASGTSASGSAACFIRGAARKRRSPRGFTSFARSDGMRPACASAQTLWLSSRQRANGTRRTRTADAPGYEKGRARWCSTEHHRHSTL